MTAATHVRLACLFAAAARLDALLTANVVFSRLSQRLIHFIILITGRYWTNDIWTAHDEDGIREGLTRETVKAIEEGSHPAQMPEDEEIIYAFCRALLTNKRVSDATYTRAVSRFGEKGVVRTTVTVGSFTYMSLAVNTAYPESAKPGRLKSFPH